MFLTFTFFSILTAIGATAIPNIHISDLAVRSSVPSSYAPVRVQCPQREQWVRPADSISPEEAIWVQGRKQNFLKSLRSYLPRLRLEEFDVDAYLRRLECEPDRIPTIGMTISGGGWLSAMTSTGVLRAFDDRFAPSVEQRTGGILQAMTYLSGLSGGSWPVMSLATHNNPSIQDMVGLWHTDAPTIAENKTTAIRPTAETIFKQIAAKFQAGFTLGLAELLGRAFSYEFVAGAEGGLTTTVSGIAHLSAFKNKEMPFPIWQAAMGTADDIQFYNLSVPYYNATMYEWSPLEFGTWGSNEWSGPASFFPTEYLGTKMVGGRPADDCIVGFDRASFLLGAAADAINFWLIEAYSNGTLGSFAKRNVQKTVLTKRDDAGPLVEQILAFQKGFEQYFNESLSDDIFVTVPNPFATSSSHTNNDRPPANLTLIDNSEAGQSLPLWTQIQQARNPEFIITWDADGDALPYSWSNGTNMYNSYTYAVDNNVPFPIIPRPATFINRNYTITPTFFGCDANLTSTNDLRAPIILYLANAPYSIYSNFSWFQGSFTDEQMATILTNSFNLVTQGNSTLDPEWPECLGCAAIDRSVAKLGLERTAQCQRCMVRYCWDGLEEDRDPGVVDPSLLLDPAETFGRWNASASRGGA